MHTEGTLRDGLYIKAVPSCYTPRQLARYLTRIRFTPKDYTDETSISDGLFPSNLDNLGRLIRLHLLAFPFENTAMHYTPEHEVNVDLQALYRRFIDEKKGSYCFGENSFFINILRGLGYRAYNIGARVNTYKLPQPTEFPSFDHLAILVQPFPDGSSNITYLADVGFSTGPCRPMLLTASDKSLVTGTTATERYRLARRADPRSSLESRGTGNESIYDSDKHWVVEVQHVNNHTPDSSTAPWIPLFTFVEDEFFQNDITQASFSYCAGKMPIHGGRFRGNVVAAKLFLVDQEGNFILDAEKAASELDNGITNRDLGRAMLVGGELKFTYRAKSEIQVIRTERERIRVLRDVFGIVITDEEKVHIKGLPSALEIDESN